MYSNRHYLTVNSFKKYELIKLIAIQYTYKVLIKWKKKNFNNLNLTKLKNSIKLPKLRFK